MFKHPQRFYYLTSISRYLVFLPPITNRINMAISQIGDVNSTSANANISVTNNSVNINDKKPIIILHLLYFKVKLHIGSYPINIGGVFLEFYNIMYPSAGALSGSGLIQYSAGQTPQSTLFWRRSSGKACQISYHLSSLYSSDLTSSIHSLIPI